MEKQTNNSRFSKRLLKVYYNHYPEAKKPHAVIRLAGFYLSELNFQIGDSIEVLAEPGKIVITKMEEKE
jgi:hypothetical protein